jgi:16S rRNA (adenine1518-N6/adenine1519-N6)-dimethyltransferase
VSLSKLRLKKGLSQNFLIDAAIRAKICNLVMSPGVEKVLEIGPGAGALTELLVESGYPVTAIEVDEAMVRLLTDKLGNKLSLIHKDVRQVDLAALIQPRGVIVGNLPYHLTGPILFQIIGELADTAYPLRQFLTHAVLMVQKEVGERLLAKPGDSAYGQLTLQAGFWFEVSHGLDVPRTAFYPAPKVDSMVLVFKPRREPVIQVRDLEKLSRLIKSSFVHRRKTLLNNLKIGGWEIENLNLPKTARPQEFSIQQFGALCDEL